MSRRKKFIIIVVFLTCIVGYGSLHVRDNLLSPTNNTVPVVPVYNGPLVQVGMVEIPVEVASSSDAIIKGLSNRDFLKPQKGMFFTFSQPARYRFWMKDMNFPLDILWIREGRVVDMHKMIPADFDPLKPVFYSPDFPAQFVLEVNAGFIDTNGIKVGDPVFTKNLDK
ncbi:MAG: DUF192 domain-containing protein [Candidatus Paceibacterota bacterium]|jgi:hypothetical protein